VHEQTDVRYDRHVDPGLEHVTDLAAGAHYSHAVIGAIAGYSHAPSDGHLRLAARMAPRRTRSANSPPRERP
jgi:hypothetical protein